MSVRHYSVYLHWVHAPHGPVPSSIQYIEILPDALEVLPVAYFLPPGHVGRVYATLLLSGGRFPDSTEMGRRTVYIHLQCHCGFSSPRTVLSTGAFSPSPCIIRTNDHITWTLSSTRGRCPPQALAPPTEFSAGLCETAPKFDDGNFDVYLPN